MTENEFTLEDRLGVIRSVNEKHNLVGNAYLSFSGGKDSTILHHLLDMALPGNEIPRVFIDTGIEYLEIRKFVMKLASSDPRFVIVKPSTAIKPMLEKYGYPFKSKEHAHMVSVYQHSGIGKSVRIYLGLEGHKMIQCPKSLKYQFTDGFPIKIGDQCCLRLKKMPMSRYQKQSGRHIAITGMRRDEGGQRKSIKGCALTDSQGHLKKFHPLLIVSDEWEEWFIERERERESKSATYTSLRSISRGQAAKVVRSPSTCRNNSPSWQSTSQTKDSNAKAFGSLYMTNTEESDSVSTKTNNSNCSERRKEWKSTKYT